MVPSTSFGPKDSNHDESAPENLLQAQQFYQMEQIKVQQQH